MDDPTDLYKTTGLVIRQAYKSALIFTSVRTSGLVGSYTPGYDYTFLIYICLLL